MVDMSGSRDASANLSVPGDSAANGSRAAKSAGAFRTISEVAGELNVPQHVLRFWETKFAQVKPLKRGGGRRYYRPEDVELLRAIRSLLYNDGYTIKGVQKLLREGGIRSMRQSQAADPAADGAKGLATEAPARSAPTFVERAVAKAPPPAELHPNPLDPETRASLKALLGELQALRDLLQK